PAQRVIIDLNDFNRSLAVHTTGQSGHLFHPHREDFVALWQKIEYHPLLYERECVEVHAEARLILNPA
ncbi:MAG: penicillin acylase family protein, partial [Ktedonobacteraceae bacterium]